MVFTRNSKLIIRIFAVFDDYLIESCRDISKVFPI